MTKTNLHDDGGGRHDDGSGSNLMVLRPVHGAMDAEADK